MAFLPKIFSRFFSPFLKNLRIPRADKAPQHIAIIMDGNGRWAQRRGFPRIAGHRAGAEALRRCVQACIELGVKHLTVYAFSTENWKRPAEEVNFLMQLLSQSIDREATNLNQSGVRLRFLGRRAELSAELQAKITEAEEKTQANTALGLNVMLNYGGRAELVDAVNALQKSGQKFPLDETDISGALYTKGIPDPDLLIRTANEMRVSNFLLWQIAYAEIYVTKTLWPDFDKEQLLAALNEYRLRVRKFGQTKEQLKAASQNHGN